VIVSRNDVNFIDLLEFINLGCGVCVHDYEFNNDGEPNDFSDVWIITNERSIIKIFKD